MNTERVTQQMISINGRDIDYYLERKPVKNLNLRIHKDGKVYVSADEMVPLAEIESFMIRKGQYILRTIDQFEEQRQYQPQPKQFVSGETFYIQGRGLRLQVSQAVKETISSDGVYLYLRVKDTGDYSRKQRMVTRYLKQQCKIVFEEVLNQQYPPFQKYGVNYPILRIRNMDTWWGSCLASKGIVALNNRLLEAPRDCIEYVVTHELCHFVHPNHSKQFYSFLSMLMPDWKERKSVLDKIALYWL